MPPLDDCRYKAFISYSHADEKWASWLHRSLETYEVPKHIVGTETRMGKVPRRVAPVFRDRDELASSTDLGADLREALAQSATQIVICSRHSAKSHWVNEEILAYKRLGRSDRIFCLIVDGEPYASSNPGHEDEECFPPALHYIMGDDGELTSTPAEPIAADARPGKDGKSLAKLKLLAGLLGVGFDSLRQRELQRRHRRMAVFTGLSTVGMVLAIGLATTAILARNEAEQQRARAESEAETARQTSSFLVSLFEVSDPGEARGREVTAREILTAGAARIDNELSGQPEVQTRLMTTIGRVYTGLGLYADAQELLTAALARRRLLASVSELEITESLVSLGEVKTHTADFEEAEQLYLESMQQLRASDQQVSPAMADTLAGLAEVYYQQGRYSEATPVLSEVLTIRQRNLGEDAPAVADAIEELGLNEYDRGDRPAAIERLREALAMRRRLLGSEPHPAVSENLNNLALVLLEDGNSEESESLYREALTMNRRLYGESHPEVAMVLNNLGQLHRTIGELTEAERFYRDALVMKRSLLGEAHPEVARVLNELAFLEHDRGQLTAAIDYTRDALAVQDASFGREHPEVAATLSRLGRWLAKTDNLTEAEPLLRESIALSSQLLDAEHPDVAIAEIGLADTLSRAGQFDEALTMSEQASRKLVSALGDDHWISAVATSIRGGVFLRMSRLSEAEPLLLSSYRQLSDAGSGARSIYIHDALERVVQLYDAQGRTALVRRYRDELAVIQRDLFE